jgi:tetratricopeptide (TPR) repeat protein
VVTRTSVALSVGLAVWLAALAAAAQTSAPPDSAAATAAHHEEQERAMQAADTEARQHFQVGKALLDAGRFAQAAEEFEAAYRLSGRPQLLYNLYVASRDAGQLDKAVESLRTYLAKVPDAPDRINLIARLDSLEAQQREKVAQEERTRAAAADAERARAEAKTRPRTVVDKSIVPWILMGSGGLLAVVSVGTGVAALNKSTELEDNCFNDTACPGSEQGNIDSAQKLSITTDVLWGTGAALAVTGFVLWVTGALDTEREVPGGSVAVSQDGFSASFATRF